jgi:MHS family proline/betaine transporter-like MFS transporter
LKIYLLSYATIHLHIAASASFTAALLSSSISAIVAPFAARLSDTFGRFKPLLFTSLASAFMLYPMFFLLNYSPTATTLISVMTASTLVRTLSSGAKSVMFASLFPPEIRSTGVGLSYNLSIMIFGGFTPWVLSILIVVTKDPLSPAFYITGICLLSALCTVLYQYKARKYL